MARAYSNDLRLRAINLMNKETKTRVAELLNITVQTLCKWWKLYLERGIVSPIKPLFERKKKVDYKELKRYVESNPDKTLKEVGKEFNCSHNAIFKILKKLNITYKKKILIRGETGRFEKRISG